MLQVSYDDNNFVNGNNGVDNNINNGGNGQSNANGGYSNSQSSPTQQQSQHSTGSSTNNDDKVLTQSLTGHRTPD